MQVIRFSDEGFKPQYQSYHLESVKWEQTEFDIEKFPEFLRRDIQANHDSHITFYDKYYDDLTSGVWVFIKGNLCRQSLNHLKEIPICWEATLPDDTFVIDVNWEKQIRLDDSLCRVFGCFVPESSLQYISNTHQSPCPDLSQLSLQFSLSQTLYLLPFDYHATTIPHI